MIEGDGLEQACEQLGAELSVDMYYLVPSEESRFEPLSVGVAVAEILVGAFAAGMLSGVTDRVAAAGASATTWLGDRLGALFAREAGEEVADPARAQEVHTLLAQVEERLDGASAGDRERVAEAVQTALADELARQSMPPSTADRVAIRVREITVEIASS